ncbi:hypothetical protein [Methanobrevibacter millerae]|nr:hypothetical protein [Methanobrevibacter millerae]
MVKRNQKLHNPDSPLLIGDVKDGDVVKEVREHSFIETHEKFYYLCIFFNQLYTNILN